MSISTVSAECQGFPVNVRGVPILTVGSIIAIAEAQEGAGHLVEHQQELVSAYETVLRKTVIPRTKHPAYK